MYSGMPLLYQLQYYGGQQHVQWSVPVIPAVVLWRPVACIVGCPCCTSCSAMEASSMYSRVSLLYQLQYWYAVVGSGFHLSGTAPRASVPYLLATSPSAHPLPFMCILPSQHVVLLYIHIYYYLSTTIDLHKFGIVHLQTVVISGNCTLVFEHLILALGGGGGF